MGGLPGNKIYGLMKGDNGSFNKYKTQAEQEKGHVDSAFYLTMNGTNLFLKLLVSLIIGYANQAFISQLVEDLSKETAMAIMEEVNSTANTSTGGVEEAAYFGTIPTSGTEFIDELTGADPCSPAKRLKTFVPPDMETV